MRHQWRAGSQRGQTLIEGALALLVFFSLMFGVIDCGLMSFLLSFLRKMETAYGSPCVGLAGSTS